MNFPFAVDYNTYVLLRHPTCTSYCVYKQVCHFVSTNKYAQQLLVKTAANCLFVRLLVAENNNAKKRTCDFWRKNCLRKEAVDRKVSVIRKDGILRWSKFIFFYQNFNVYPPFLPK